LGAFYGRFPSALGGAGGAYFFDLAEKQSITFTPQIS
jgi:hypothetical protein